MEKNARRRRGASVAWLSLSVAASLLLLCGCSTRYIITQSGGIKVTSYGKPKLKGNFYYYKDAKGQTKTIPRGRLLSYEPASDAAAEEKQFQAAPVSKPKHWYWPF